MQKIHKIRLNQIIYQMVWRVKTLGGCMNTFYKNKIEHCYLGGYCEIDKERKIGVEIDEHIKYRILQIIRREYNKASRKIM